MNLINFKSNSIVKNLKRALNASKHIQKGEKVKFNSNEMFPRNEHVDKYINLIVSEIMEIEIIHNNFSKIYIEKHIMSILENLNSRDALKLKKQNFNNISIELLNNFENEIENTIEEEFDNYLCIFHITNLKLINPLTIGNVTLFPIKTMNNELEKYNEDIVGGDFFIEKQVYAKTRIYGSKEFAHSKAQNNIKIALNMLKLLLPDRQCNFNLDGDVFSPNYRQYVIFTSDDKIASGVKLEGSIFHCEFTKENVGDVRHELNVLSILFNKKNKSDFENRLITAIYWFGEAMSIKMNEYKKIGNKHQSLIDNFEFFNAYPKLLYLVIALETVFVFDDESKSEAVSSKVSALIANPGYENDIKKFLKDIYDIRSSIVHSGIDYISKDDLKKLTKYTRLALFYIISINYKFNNELYKLNSEKESMKTKKYIFKIPFVLNDHSMIKITEDDEVKFKLEPYTVYISLFKDGQKGNFEIPFNDKDKIYDFYHIFKLTLNRLNIIEKYGSWSIKLEDINEDNLNNYIHEKNTAKILVDEKNYKEISTSFNLKMNVEIDYILSFILSAIINDITLLYDDPKNSKIKNDIKLNTALDIYANSFFQKDKPRYLSYFNILELLKPTIKRDEETLTCVENIIEYVDDYKESFDLENNELLKKDFDSLKSSIGNLKNKSFTPSILQLVNDYNILLEGFNDLENWISSAYTIRNKFAHKGEILDNFDECLNFLENLIPTLLLAKIKKDF